MSDDKTLELSTYFPLTVRAEEGVLHPGNLRFIHSFRIGRSEDCEVRCVDRSVSRVHLDVLFEGGQWWVQDHQSRNGTFVDDQKIDRVCLRDFCTLRLGKNGPMLSLQVDNLLDDTVISAPQTMPEDDSSTNARSSFLSTSSSVSSESGVGQLPDSPDGFNQKSGNLEEAAQANVQGNLSSLKDSERDLSALRLSENKPSSDSQENFDQSIQGSNLQPPASPGRLSKFVRRKPQESATQIFRKVLRQDSAGEAGPSTVIIRTALKQAFQQKSRRYLLFLGGIGVLAVFLGLVAWVQYLKVESMKETASELFFSMKTMELGLAQLENVFVDQLQPDNLKAILARRDKLKAMQVQYEKFLEEIGIYSSTMSEEDRSIMRMARLFGECEIGMPPDFIKTVKSYIQKWRTTDRLTNSVERAQNRGYGHKVSKIMLAHHMPPQFFYLGLQESNFNTRAVGPRTRFGIAKGPWQFIPSTASEYGLQNGPLVAYQKYDPHDERHNFEKATRAAAKYLNHIYTTEAQASGLLVMASYNWGQTRVRKLIRQLPENPRERNFWELLKRFKIPRETYDYVFYIFSAAVIGENPSLFGFSFPNPLNDGEG
jgi:soluble lytic murein transglycosylase-like protein